MARVTLPDGETVPALGLGTWKLEAGMAGEAEAIRALQRGLDLGLTLIDTAEMYGAGRSEQLVARAIAGRRNDVFLVSKVLPSNASRAGTIAACERSLRNLSTDRLDLYLLHWEGPHPLAETIEAFEQLKARGLIRHWGVSNFDTDAMQQLTAMAGGAACAADQVQYSLTSRGIEHDLLPWCQQRGLPVMAYCPLGEGDLADHPVLRQIGVSHGVSAAAIALAFLLTRPQVIAIPKSRHVARVEDNARALDVRLTDGDLAALDAAFPPPRRKVSLAMT